MSLRQKILATVAYADIFDYPLTEAELCRWMIGTSSGVIPKKVSDTERIVRNGETYLTLTGRSSIVRNRLKREEIAGHKWNVARRMAGRFRWIPTVLLVGVTGGLAVNNARFEDDIDLFFVTKRGTLWATRFFVTIVADVMGVRRHPDEHAVENKICLNMFMAEDALTLPTGERDLFSAHEVLQMVPLWERGGAYRTFLTDNRWVKYFLPNAWKEKIKAPSIRQISNKHQIGLEFGIWSLRFLELPSRVLQLWYMKRRRTTEVISPGVLRFHPKDARVWVKEKYAKRLERYNIPLDNVFYHR